MTGLRTPASNMRIQGEARSRLVLFMREHAAVLLEAADPLDKQK